MRIFFVAAFLITVGTPAMAQETKPEVVSLAYALERICARHIAGVDDPGFVDTEISSNGWSNVARGGGIIYDKAADWGRIQVLYGTKDFSGRCTISVTPATAKALDVDAMRAGIATFVSKRFPNAKHEKDRLPAETNKDVLESVWTAENARWSVQVSELAHVESKPVMRVVWNRSF